MFWKGQVNFFFMTVIQVSRNHSYVWIRTEAMRPVAVLLKMVTARTPSSPQVLQPGRFQPLFVFFQLSKLRQTAATHMQILPLVTLPNDRSLNQFDSSLYQPPSSSFTPTKKVLRRKQKALTDSREAVSLRRW